MNNTNPTLDHTTVIHRFILINVCLIKYLSNEILDIFQTISLLSKRKQKKRRQSKYVHEENIEFSEI